MTIQEHSGLGVRQEAWKWARVVLPRYALDEAPLAYLHGSVVELCDNIERTMHYTPCMTMLVRKCRTQPKFDERFGGWHREELFLPIEWLDILPEGNA